jgi:O-antigen ligase
LIRIRCWFPTLALLIALAAGAVWFVRGDWTSPVAPQPTPLPLVLLALMWVLRLVRTKGQRLTPPVYTAPLILFLATAGIGIWAAYDPIRAWAKAWLIVGALGLYWAMAAQPDVPRLYVALALWALVGTALAGYFIVSGGTAALPFPVPQVAAASFNPNIAASVMAMTLPFYVPLIALARRGAILSSHPPMRRVIATLWFIALSITLISLVLTTSRGAGLAVAVTGLAWAVGYVMTRLDRRRVALALLLALALAAGIGIAAAGGNMPLFDLAPDTALGNRLYLMRHGALLARNTPFTGIGPGMFEMHFAVYTLLIHVGYIGHSHNVLIDMAIEQGLLAAAAYATVIVTALLVGVNRLRTNDAASGTENQQRATLNLVLPAALAALLITFLHGLVDDALYGSRALLFLLVPLGLLRAAGYHAPLGHPRNKPAAHIAAAAAPLLLTAILVLSIVWAWGGEPSIDGVKAAWHANFGAVAQARSELTVYDQRRFNALSIDAVRRREDLTEATAHFERALAQDPTHPTARQRLAMVMLARYDYAGALTMMQEAWDAGHRDRITRLLYGDALVATGRVGEAVEAIQGLQFVRDRLLGQAWERYHQTGDREREAYAREAAAQLEE